MNFLGTISRGLILTALVLVGNAKASRFPKWAYIGVTSATINEKCTAEIFGEEYISARKQVIIGKALVGGMVNFPDAPAVRTVNLSDGRCGQARPGKDLLIPYILVNGGLRYAVDSSVDQKLGKTLEKIIEEKCDEYCPENVAWLAKPVVTGIVDLAYDYVTIKLVKGFVDGINKSK